MSAASQTGFPRDESSQAGVPWIMAAQGGCRESLGQAVEACRQYLLLIAEREIDPRLRARGGASDLVQETMIVAQQRFGRFHGRTEAELRAWTRRILLNRIAEFRRHHRGAGKRAVGHEVPLALHEWSAEQAGAATSPSGDAQRDERLEALRQAVDALPERCRLVFCWKHQEGCSHEEIGRRLGISTEAAQKRWTRTIERLQAELGSLL